MKEVQLVARGELGLGPVELKCHWFLEKENSQSGMGGAVRTRCRYSGDLEEVGTEVPSG